MSEEKEITLLEKVQGTKKILAQIEEWLGCLLEPKPESPTTKEGGVSQREQSGGLLDELRTELREVDSMVANIHSQAHRILSKFTEVKP